MHLAAIAGSAVGVERRAWPTAACGRSATRDPSPP